MKVRSKRALLLGASVWVAATGGDTHVLAAAFKAPCSRQALDDEGSSIDLLLDQAWFRLEIERDPRAALVAVDAAYGGADRPRRPMDPDQAARAWALRLAARALQGVATLREFETGVDASRLPAELARMVDAARARVRLRRRSGDEEDLPHAPTTPPVATSGNELVTVVIPAPPTPPVASDVVVRGSSSNSAAQVGPGAPPSISQREETAASPPAFGEVSPRRNDVDGWTTALDERARAWRSRLRASGVEVEVFALLGRSFAARDLGVEASLAYQVSTYHLTRRTRDDVTGVGNSWELSYGNGRSRFACRMTSDQLSLLYPLLGGSQDGEELGPPVTTLDVEAGARAVLHVERAGAPGGAWYRLEVLESSRARYAIVAFRPESALPIIDRWIDRARRDLRLPRIELGLELRRATTARVCMHGANSLSGRSDRGSAIERGGLVPRGSRYRIDTLKGLAVLDPAGGSARVVIGGRVVAEVVGSGERILSAEGLSLWILPGEEPTVYLELQGRGRADVELSGVLVRE